MTDGRKSADALQIMLLLKACMGERQVVGNHQHRDVIDSLGEPVKRNNGLRTHGCIDTWKNIEDLALTHEIGERNVLKLRVDQRDVWRAATH